MGGFDSVREALEEPYSPETLGEFHEEYVEPLEEVQRMYGEIRPK